MTEKEFAIVAVETHSKQDCGFTVDFGENYSPLLNGFPITEETAEKAIQDAYDAYPTLNEITEFEENEQVGTLYVNDDGEYVRTEF